ncbi:MAG: hypothetical protein JSW67_10135 [Candidatus Latescibacterota bacterium]|nr:MAG: hypothetical protein JSW67_10135 [Candidatus Latescibacterota bacterium]
MDCSRFVELAQFYMDADLDPVACIEMERHQRRCDHCCETLDEYRTLFEQLNAMEREPAPPWLELLVLVQVGTPTRPAAVRSVWRRRLRWLRARPLRLAFALTAVAAILWVGSEPTITTLFTALGQTLTGLHAATRDLASAVRWLQVASLAELRQVWEPLLRGSHLFIDTFGAHILIYTSATMLMATLLDRRVRLRVLRGHLR